MLEIISGTELVTETIKFHSFEDKSCPGAGFTFDCDSEGNIIITDSNRDNVKKCQNGTYNVVDQGVQTETYTHKIAPVGKCVCGEEVSLEGFTNTCECGRDYNMSGQELAHRSQWGEETGESIQEILSV